MNSKAESKRLRSSYTANQTAAELLAVPVSASEEEVIEQVADRRGVEARSLINLGLKEAAGTGGPISAPTVHKKLLDLSAKAQKVSEAPEDHLGPAELHTLRLELLMWGREIRTRRRERKRLWDKAAKETSTEVIWTRLDGKESAHLREKSEQAGIPPKVLLRQGLLQALDRQSEMKELESWIGRWANRAERLHERSASNRGAQFQGWEKMAEIGEEIDTVVRGNVLR